MRRHLVAASLLAALALPGCVVYDHRAEVTLRWVVGTNQTCFPGDTVVTELTELGTSFSDIVSSPCTDFAVTIGDLQPDTYAVSLTLVDANGSPQVRLDDTIPVHAGFNEYPVYSLFP